MNVMMQPHEIQYIPRTVKLDADNPGEALEKASRWIAHNEGENLLINDVVMKTEIVAMAIKVQWVATIKYYEVKG